MRVTLSTAVSSGRDVARHDRLQRRDDVSRHQHRVDAQLRAGAVRPSARDRDVEERAARRSAAPCAIANCPDRLAGPVVQGEHLRRRETARTARPRAWRARRRHPSSPGWKMKCTVPSKLRRRGEIARRAEQHRGVAVVAAGVHQPRLAASDARRSVCLLHRQRSPCRRAGRSTRRPSPRLQHADHAGLADAAVHLDAPLGELGRDDLGRAVLLQPELRVARAGRGGWRSAHRESRGSPRAPAWT